MKNAPEFEVRYVRSIDDFMRVVAIRTEIYIGEQECPYEEEFDGNDFCAVHLLAEMEAEPVGCMRIRFFADFAKLERTSIRPKFRGSEAMRLLTKEGIDFSRRKGYARIITHAQARYARLWNRVLGFKEMPESARFSFSDYDYVAMELTVEPEAAGWRGAGAGIDHMALNRPEGEWERPGVLERPHA